MHGVGSHEDDATRLCDACHFGSRSNEFVQTLRAHEPLPVRAGDDAERTIFHSAFVEVDAQHDDSVEGITGRTAVVLTVLDGPGTEPIHFHPLAHRDRGVLVPGHQPVCSRGLIEQDRTDHERAFSCQCFNKVWNRCLTEDCDDGGRFHQHTTHAGSGMIGVREQRLAQVTQGCTGALVHEPVDLAATITIKRCTYRMHTQVYLMGTPTTFRHAPLPRFAPAH